MGVSLAASDANGPGGGAGGHCSSGRQGGQLREEEKGSRGRGNRAQQGSADAAKMPRHLLSDHVQKETKTPGQSRLGGGPSQWGFCPSVGRASVQGQGCRGAASGRSGRTAPGALASEVALTDRMGAESASWVRRVLPPLR